MLTDGRISHLLNDYKPWKPWWLHRMTSPPLIIDVDTPTASVDLPETVPTIVSSLVPLPTLTSILPHVHVRFDVFEILFGYVLITVRYRGDIHSYLAEAGTEFIHIASRHIQHVPIESNEHDDPLSMLHARLSLVRERLQDTNVVTYRISEQFFVNLLADIRKILHGPYSRERPTNHFLLAALSDLRRFLVRLQTCQASPVDTSTNDEPARARSISGNVFHSHRTQRTVRMPIEKQRRTLSHRFNRRHLTILTRKLDYLLSWTVSHGNRLIMLDYELEQIERDLRRQLSDYQRDRTRIEKHLQRMRLQQTNHIEELPSNDSISAN
jgi:hypothetical protein